MLVTQVRWRDEVTLADGTLVTGTVVRKTGGYVVTEADGREREVLDADVATSRYGGRDIPKVSVGFPTLARRLSGEIPIVAGVLLAFVALAILTAWRWRWLVEALGLPMSGRDAVRYTLYGIFFNLVVPGATGGDVVKAYYAAKSTGAATKAVVSVFVDRAVGLFALVLLAAAVLHFGPDHEGFDTPRLLVRIVLGAAVLVIVLVLSRRVRRGLGLSALLKRLPFQRVWGEVDAAFRLYRSHPGSLALGLGVSFVNHVGGAVCAWLLARALGLGDHVSFATVLAIVPVIGLLSAIPLLPGGWGVGELAFAFFFAPLGIPASEAVGWSVVFRLSILASGIPGGILWLLSREHVKRREMAEAVHEAEREAGEALAARSPESRAAPD